MDTGRWVAQLSCRRVWSGPRGWGYGLEIAPMWIQEFLPFSKPWLLRAPVSSPGGGGAVSRAAVRPPGSWGRVLRSPRCWGRALGLRG